MKECPIDVQQISDFFIKMNANFELPWSPRYTQTGEDVAADAGGMAYYALAATIAFTVCVFSLEGNLDARQRDAYLIPTFPKQLEQTVSRIDKDRATTKPKKEEKKEEESNEKDDEKKKDDPNEPLLPKLQSKFENAQSYGLDKINFGMISSTFDAFESVFFLIIGFLPYAWDLSVTTGEKYFGWSETENEIKISLIFLLLTTVLGIVTSLPFELYSTFRIEKKHGFNKMTVGLFFADKVKSTLLSIVIGGPFVAILLTIIKMGGPFFFIYVWAFMFVFSLFMMTVYPVFIMPLFNKYEKLDDGDLKTRIYALADRLKYPLTNLFVMDGSKRSSHSNAFMFGFGKNKRIVLFDTLLTQVQDNEILGILGHELGHWKLGHTMSNFVITQLYSGAAFYFFSLCYTSQELVSAFGFNDISRPVPTIIALLLFFQTLWAPVDKILSFLLTVFSRYNEFSADKFSHELGYSEHLQSGLVKIHLENLGAMCPDPWYSMYHYSHPPLVERLSAMMTMDKMKKQT
mmetsp:Transcript_11361/g.13003  ORF Transcript_11361/g.13003 Transcript_11361/m.13003 type:complete len:517 (+) Transcript_11361:180-1730(+)